ncbi:nuclear transport factor 2 family protein [Asanoa sp. NPDC050611]|uniref:nuclear transport factor 2 family protein n=1 Tax=Asanoa sp. NPDC050611 TaxID=3157098 RepID=UPI0033F211A8
MWQARISEAVRELALEPTLPFEEALDKYYAPDYEHRNDGATLDRAGFAAMVEGFRGRIANGTITVLDEVRDGSTYAERHVYAVTMKDGSRLHRELYVFATYAPDGRFRTLSETGFDR